MSSASVVVNTSDTIKCECKPYEYGKDTPMLCVISEDLNIFMFADAKQRAQLRKMLDEADAMAAGETDEAGETAEQGVAEAGTK